ncbi:MAG: VCBS repeat-containing protein [Deltaproteobacteria bacterium]|nr:VCBS repeat-containing protein [Deltaproteobacteria bacterium]
MRLALAAFLFPAIALGQNPAFIDHAPGVFGALNEGYPDAMGGGVAFVDLDADGWDDVLVAHNTNGVHAYRNGGPADDFTFTNVTGETGLPMADHAGIISLSAGDLDGDGDQDVVLGTRKGALLYANDGDGTFRDATGGAFNGVTPHVGGVAIGDLDRDGLEDVYIVAYLLHSRWPFHECWPNQLFENLGDLAMREVAQSEGVANEGCGLSGLLFDYDDDGDLDMSLANDFGPFSGPNALYRNDGLDEQGGAVFADVSVESGFDRRIYGMGLAAADVNGDERPDVFTTNIGRTILMASDGAGGFRDLADEAGVASPFAFDGWRVTWGAAFLDAGNDGIPDLANAAGFLAAAAAIRNGTSQPNAYYPDLAPGMASLDLAAEVGAAPSDSGHGLAVGDFDRDGHADILTAAINGNVHLYRNDGSGAAGASLRLIGTVSGTDAVGARVALECDGLRRVQWRDSTGSYGSRGSMLVTMPLGGCEGTTPVVTVRWPSGAISRHELDDGGGARDLVEPAWLTVEPEWLAADGLGTAVVTVRPSGEDGTELGPGHAIGISAEDLVVSDVVDNVDGSYTATIAAPSSPRSHVRVRTTVDGVTLPHAPRLRIFARDRSVVAASPAYVSGGTMEVYVHPMDASGNARGAGLDVSLDVEGGSVSAGPSDLGDGSYVATVQGDGGEVTIEARVAGEAVGSPFRSQGVQRIDPVQTSLSVWPGWIMPAEAADTQVEITISPRTALGEIAQPAGTEVTLRGPSGDVVEPLDVQYRSKSILVTIGAATLHDEGPLDVFLDEAELSRPADLEYYDDPMELLGAVDPARSRLAPYHESVYADGDDFAWLIGELEDSDGDIIAVPDDFQVFSELGAPFGLRVLQGGKQFEAKVRSGIVAGIDHVEVGWGGLGSGVTATVYLVGHPERTLEGVSLDLCLSALHAPADSEATISAMIRPRDARTGLLVGPGVPITVLFDPIEGAIATEYYEPGAYRAAIGPVSEPVDAFVHVGLPASGASTRALLSFYDPLEPPLDPPRQECALVEPGVGEGDGGADADSDADSDGDSDADSDADSDGDTDADAGGNSDAGGDGDADADADSDADRDGGWVDGPPRWRAEGGCGCAIKHPDGPICGIFLLAIVVAWFTSQTRRSRAR